MNDMTPMIGHNNPPDPIEAVIALHDETLSEVQNWADGQPVEDEASMTSVDALIKAFKTYKSDLRDAAKERTEPLHKAWKAEIAAVKVYTDDADLMQKTLVALVAPFKAKLVAQKEAERREAWEKAQAAQREAEAKIAAANAADIEAQREAREAQQAALDATKTAQTQSKDTIKGMRTVHHHEVTDMRGLVNWIATNDKDAMAEFATAYAAKHHRTAEMHGVRTWSAKEAF